MTTGAAAGAGQHLKDLHITLPAAPTPFGACNAEVHIVNAGHFALDTAADDIATLIHTFVGSLHPIAVGAQ